MPTDLTVANTILEQLGGRRFIAMTGARTLIAGNNYMSFGIPGGGGRTKDNINHVRITLEPSDTYKVEFLRIHALKYKTISTHDDIYAENLVPLFERVTGLRTSLGTMGVRA